MEKDEDVDLSNLLGYQVRHATCVELVDETSISLMLCVMPD